MMMMMMMMMIVAPPLSLCSDWSLTNFMVKKELGVFESTIKYPTVPWLIMILSIDFSLKDRIRHFLLVLQSSNH